MHLKISDPTNYHVALYIRLSKEDINEGESESVSNQRSMLEQFVKECKLNVYDTYVDDGWSGTNFDRPAFQRLLRDIEAGNVNMVITKDLSRLGRDYILTGHYMEKYFPEHQVRYISLLDGIDTGIESAANDITPFRAIMNDMYAKDISKKISSVKHDKQRKGLFIGGKPVYGYKMHPTEKNKIIVDEQAAQTVRRIFAMALRGTSCRQIAVQLNEEGIPTPAVYAGLPVSKQGPYTGKWSSERIADMLKNETYIGNMVQGRMRKVSYKSKKCVRMNPKDWVVVEGTHEPLVDVDTFQRVNRLLDSRRHTRSCTYDFLLKGLIFCHECGHPLAVVNRKNTHGKTTLYFVCRTYQRFTKAGVCTSHCVKEQTITDAVLSKVEEICHQYLERETLLTIAERETAFTQQNRRYEREISALHNKIETLTANLDKIYLDKLSGLLDDADFTRVYTKVKQERKHSEERLAELTRQQSAITPPDQTAYKLVEQFIEGIPNNRELLVNLIERVELTAEKQIIIRFRFPELNCSA